MARKTNSKQKTTKHANPATRRGVDFNAYGYLRTAAVSPELVLGNPMANAKRIATHLRALARQKVALALFPELSLTGYTCDDLFFSNSLHQHVIASLTHIARATDKIVCVVGAPWRSEDDRLLNVAAVLGGGRVYWAWYQKRRTRTMASSTSGAGSWPLMNS